MTTTNDTATTRRLAIELIRELAACTKDGELTDEGVEFVLMARALAAALFDTEGDDAVDTLESFISWARSILGVEEDKS